jgi:thiol:disulfide interchange protein DsbD
MKRTIFSIAILLLTFIGAFSQIKTPIKWNNKVEMTSAKEGDFVFVVTVDQGWHLYGFNLPEGGPKSTNIIFDKNDNVELIGSIVPSIPPTEKVDPIFSLQLSWWDSNVTFKQKFRIKEDVKTTITGRIEFQGCNNESCIAPTKEVFSLEVGSGQANTMAVVDSVVVQQPQMIQPQQNQLTPQNSAENSWWAPVEVPAEDASEQPSTNSPWWMIFIYGFFGGLAALITPCVWPLIPMTVSFFLKKNKSKAKSIQDAMTYGVAIIVIYLILGLAITVIFGAGKLNELATSAVFNIIFFVLLVVFGISFLGAFDIKLPSKWSNAIDGKAEQTTGFISIFFMAFTLALVSFSCTGPLIGTLLVEAASIGDISGPAIGMAGFAIALAIPFTLFAIFPSMLKSMPKSGGWLNSVKVVLGFLELALALKFLSVADLCEGWGILDREVFLVLWIVIFAMLGFYLLGKLKFAHDADLQYVSVPRLFLAIVSFAFVVYMIPGLWGAPLKSISAFAPPLSTQDFNLYGGGFKEFDDYDAGMKYAEENNMPVLIDFTGHGCVNCRKMESAVFDTERIHKVINENYVLIKLVVDDKADLDSAYTINENGKTKLIETVGDKWSYLQQHKFQTSTQPYYVVLDNNGNPLINSRGYDPAESVDAFEAWLIDGVEEYNKNKK